MNNHIPQDENTYMIHNLKMKKSSTHDGMISNMHNVSEKDFDTYSEPEKNSETHVARIKYDLLKGKAIRWRDQAINYQTKYEKSLKESEKLIDDNYELQNQNNNLLDEIESYRKRTKTILKENEMLIESINTYKNRYRELKSKLKEMQKEKDEERIVEKLSQRVGLMKH